MLKERGMFDLVFSDSVKAAMAIAKAESENVESLWLELDTGDIKGLPDLGCRQEVMFSILEGPEGQRDDSSCRKLWDVNLEALERVVNADNAREDVRIWWSDSPAEACGFFFAVSLLEEADVNVTSVKLPPYFEQGENICAHDSLKSVEPKKLLSLLQLEKRVSPALRRAVARRWGELVSENAPLRAMVNGRLMSVPADFYDHTLRRQFTDGEFTVAQAIGRAMGMSQPGISDWLYAQRMRSMIEAGELEVVKPDRNFYFASVRKKTF